MKTKLNRTACAVVLALLYPLTGHSQDRKVHGTWEFGLGGAAMNLTRTTVSNFRQTAGGDYIFNLDEKTLYGGIELYSALELKRWLYADLQGTLGLVRYYDAEMEKRGYSFMVSPGVQFRPFVGCEWIQPYFRLGINCYHKTFPTAYFGQFKGDVTKEALWRAEDAWNKGYTFDSDTFFPVSAGVGVIGWMTNRLGVHIQGQYNRSLGTDGINFAQASAGIVLRLGGGDKNKAVADRYVPKHLDEYASLYPQKVVEKEVVREIPVEVIREVVKEVPSEKTLAELLDNVNFDFDKATITADSQFIRTRLLLSPTLVFWSLAIQMPRVQMSTTIDCLWHVPRLSMRLSCQEALRLPGYATEDSASVSLCCLAQHRMSSVGETGRLSSKG